MVRLLYCLLGILFLNNVFSSPVDEPIKNYFKSDMLEDFNNVWRRVRRSYEQAVAIGLKEAFGTETQNVFIPQDSPQLASAYYLTDNVVTLILQNLTLKYQIPRLRPYTPEVNLALTDNLIRVHGDLDQIFVDADYYLVRNKSDILWEPLHDPYKKSPFTLQQVQKQGKLTIVAQNCKLVGIATSVIRGLSVGMGYSRFQVTRCQFRIEIHTPGYGSPPVMAPYFSRDQGRIFENLLSKPISNEITPKLQGILFSTLNTTSIFDLKVGAIRNAQRHLNRKVNEYMTKIVATMNDITSKTGNRGFVPLTEFKLVWDDAAGVDYPTTHSVILKEMTLNGLETAYCAQVGGPYRTPSVKIVDEIRFQELQVRGKMYLENATYKEMIDFTIELLDVVVSFKLYVEDGPHHRPDEPEQVQDENDYDEEEENRRANDLHKQTNYFLDFVGWRSLEYYVVTGPKNPLYSIVVGYIVDEVPLAMINHLYSVLDQAVAQVDSGNTEQVRENTGADVVRGGIDSEKDENNDDITHDAMKVDGNSDSGEFSACKYNKNKRNCNKRKKTMNTKKVTKPTKKIKLITKTQPRTTVRRVSSHTPNKRITKTKRLATSVTVPENQDYDNENSNDNETPSKVNSDDNMNGDGEADGVQYADGDYDTNTQDDDDSESGVEIVNINNNNNNINNNNNNNNNDNNNKNNSDDNDSGRIKVVNTNNNKNKLSGSGGSVSIKNTNINTNNLNLKKKQKKKKNKNRNAASLPKIRTYKKQLLKKILPQSKGINITNNLINLNNIISKNTVNSTNNIDNNNNINNDNDRNNDNDITYSNIDNSNINNPVSNEHTTKGHHQRHKKVALSFKLNNNEGSFNEVLKTSIEEPSMNDTKSIENETVMTVIDTTTEENTESEKIIQQKSDTHLSNRNPTFFEHINKKPNAIELDGIPEELISTTEQHDRMELGGEAREIDGDTDMGDVRPLPSEEKEFT